MTYEIINGTLFAVAETPDEGGELGMKKSPIGNLGNIEASLSNAQAQVAYWQGLKARYLELA